LARRLSGRGLARLGRPRALVGAPEVGLRPVEAPQVEAGHQVALPVGPRAQAAEE
jgi:hypothetical protein